MASSGGIERAFVDLAAAACDVAVKAMVGAAAVTQSHKDHLNYQAYADRLRDLQGDLEGVVEDQLQRAGG